MTWEVIAWYQNLAKDYHVKFLRSEVTAWYQNLAKDYHVKFYVKFW